MKYELKKTKKIKKTCDSISTTHKTKTKFIIEGKMAKDINLPTKPLLMTFENHIIQFIKEERNGEKAQNLIDNFSE